MHKCEWIYSLDFNLEIFISENIRKTELLK